MATALAEKDEDPRPCLCLAILFELLQRGRSLVQASGAVAATCCCWFWPFGCKAEEISPFLGSALLRLGRLLKDKLSCVVQDLTACLSCRRDSKEDKQPVTVGGWARGFLCGAGTADSSDSSHFKLQSFTQPAHIPLCSKNNRTNASRESFYCQSARSSV